MGKNTVQAQQWLEKCYPDCAPSKITIFRWYADLKRGRTDTNDAGRLGRPNEAITPENIRQVSRPVTVAIYLFHNTKICKLNKRF